VGVKGEEQGERERERAGEGIVWEPQGIWYITYIYIYIYI